MKLIMGKDTLIDIIKIKKIVADIREFPAKIDSTEVAKHARHLLKKYALLSEKIERNVLVGAEYQKDLAKIRTEEFKDIRRQLKEKANSILHGNNKTKTKSEKPVTKTAKAPASKKPAAKAAKASTSKTTAKKPAKAPAAKKTSKAGSKKADNS